MYDIKHFYLKWNNRLKPEVGELPLSEVILNFLKECKEGQLVEVIIRKHSGKRSNQVNRYIHWMFRFIAKELGVNMLYIKESMKQLFLSEEFMVKGRLHKYVKETRSLSAIEASQFIEDVRSYWQTFCDLYVPSPEEIEIKE